MQEINDYIMNGLYKGLFASRRLAKKEVAFQHKIDMLNESVGPKDFGIPPNQLTDLNMAMYLKAIKELQKVEKYPTPSLKI